MSTNKPKGRWQDVLTKTQQAHLRQHGITSKKQLRLTLERQDAMRAATGILACGDCHDIKHRLFGAGRL